MKRRDALKSALVLGIAAVTSTRAAFAQSPAKLPVVGITEFASFPAGDEVRNGVIKGLEQAGFVDGKNVRIELQNAHADFATATSILQKFRDQKVDLIVTLGTPTLQLAYNLIKDVGYPPVVFALCNSAYAIKVARSPTDKPAFLTGVQNPATVPDIIKLLQEVMPLARRIGVPYNPAEVNSVDMVMRARKALEGTNVVLVETPVSRTDEVQVATQSLVARGIDAILMVNDNILNAAYGSLMKVSLESKKPLFSLEPAMVSRGAMAGVGLNWGEGGFEAGKMAAAILKGKSPKDIPIGTLGEDIGQTKRIAFNVAVAQWMGVAIPDAALKRAATIARELPPK